MYWYDPFQIYKESPKSILLIESMLVQTHALVFGKNIIPPNYQTWQFINLEGIFFHYSSSFRKDFRLLNLRIYLLILKSFY